AARLHVRRDDRVAPGGRARADRRPATARSIRDRRDAGEGRPVSRAPVERVGVAVVGGGPAGALVAARLAWAGHEVVLLERDPAHRWRACGVFSSPATIAGLRALGVGEAALRRAA